MTNVDISSKKKPVRYSVKGKRSRFFDAQGVDEIVSICMVMAQEMWVLKERQVALEAIIKSQNVQVPEDVDSYEFSPEQRESLDTDRQGFIDRIFFTLREEAESLLSEPEDEPNTPEAP